MTQTFCHAHSAEVYDDTCDKCIEENPTMERSFRGYISIRLAELTGNGEFSAEDGWNMIQKDIDHAIANLRPTKDEAEFLEWETVQPPIPHQVICTWNKTHQEDTIWQTVDVTKPFIKRYSCCAPCQKAVNDDWRRSTEMST